MSSARSVFLICIRICICICNLNRHIDIATVDCFIVPFYTLSYFYNTNLLVNCMLYILKLPS
jgi:hypothetical protein